MSGIGLVGLAVFMIGFRDDVGIGIGMSGVIIGSFNVLYIINYYYIQYAIIIIDILNIFSALS